MRWPWQDRRGALSPLKAGTLAMMFVPGALMAFDYLAGRLGPLPVDSLVYWSGVWATALLLLALAVTPARRIFRWGEAVAVRRMIGVSALAYSVFHCITYFMLYKWDWSYMLADIPRRLTLIVALLSMLGLIALGATSSDAAMRWLGTGWRRLHRTNYVLTALAVAHYFLSPGIFPLQYVMGGTLFWLLAWRGLAANSERAGEPAVLAGLALVAALFTAALEATWMRLYHRVPVAQTLADSLDPELAVAASWQVLALGLAVALAAALARTTGRIASATR